jgi:probable phosphoglycerate mutase
VTAGLDGSDGPELATGADGAKAAPARGWSFPGQPPTRLVLIRHGETDHTTQRRFSGGLLSANPGLNDTGRSQVRATAEWLAPVADQIDVVLASPVRRTRESAEIVAAGLGKHEVLIDEGFAEMEFGTWDGMTFIEVSEVFPEELQAWFGSMDHAPGGGESFRMVEQRVLEGLDRVLTTYAGKTVALVSHVTPIKTLVAHALEAPLTSLYRLELTPASVTVLSYFLGGENGDERMASMRTFNATPSATAFPLG